MELYIFVALFLLYAVMSFVIDRRAMEKVWTFSFICSFIATSVAIGFLRLNHQDALMSVSQINWYFILYVFGSVSVVLGIINLWIYRKSLYRILFSDDEDETND